MRIVVIGGVAAGMSFAARARRLDESAEIIVLERGEHVSFANCGLPYFVGGEIKNPDALLVQTPEKLQASLNLDVRTNHNVIGLDAANKTLQVQTPQGLTEIEYDSLMLAPGATAFLPPIPGIDSPRLQTLRTVSDALKLREQVVAKDISAVVLGAGFIGVEAAEALAEAGAKVTLVELADHVLPPLDTEIAFYVTKELARLGINVRSGVAASEIRPGTDFDTVVLADGTEIEADVIVASLGVRPDTAIFSEAGLATERGAILVDAHGKTNLPDVWAAGDAVLSKDPVTGALRPVALAGPANRAGRLIADAMIRPELAREIPLPLGTAIVRVGKLTVALTGASEQVLTAAGVNFETLRLHPNQHAGYFPGASAIHLNVFIDPESGTIFGAQAVGEDGVDKRIDVLATAIRGGLTISDLIDLDLSYSPPYGQAKDAVNLAGMVGENVLNGTLKVWQPNDLAQVQEEALVLDVRTPAEVASGIVPGALLIPHTKLRENLDLVREKAAGRPVRVMCAAGVRSAIAHRILVQNGFDSASLMGGTASLRAILGDRVGEVLVAPDAAA